jgi:hypothetical protein
LVTPEAILPATLLPNVNAMILFELDEDTRILHVRPTAPLQEKDFGEIADKIDPFIEKDGSLAGLIVESESFPGWESMASLIQHFQFIRNHHRQIAKVALVTNTPLAAIAEKIGNHFIGAEIKVFPAGQAEAAKRWVA